MAFNALKYVEELEKAGIPEKHAKAQVKLLNDIIDSNLATKQDLKELEVRLSRDLKELELKLKHDLTVRLGVLLAAGIGIVAALVKLL